MANVIDKPKTSVLLRWNSVEGRWDLTADWCLKDDVNPGMFCYGEFVIEEPADTDTWAEIKAAAKARMLDKEGMRI